MKNISKIAASTRNTLRFSAPSPVSLIVLVTLLLFSSTISIGQTRRTPVRPSASPAPQRPQPSESEQLLWQEALRRDTRDAYEFYLREFPQGAYTKEARAKIAEIATRAETARWDSAVAANTKASFENYLKEYPNGRYSADAKERIKKFDRDEEDSVWKEADRKDDVASYTSYLQKYPSGVYASVARLRLSALGAALPESIGSTRTNSIGMEFAWIPSGSFMMGSTDSDLASVEAECRRSVSTCTYKPSDEGPQRRVTIAKGFWMGRHEVTQGQYEAVMGTNPSFFKNCGKDCPVETVSWNDAKEFIKRLNDRNDGFVYSLPTEAEWEYAARAGTAGTRYGNLDDIAWYVDNAGDRRLDGYKVWLQDSKGDASEFLKILGANGNRTRKVGLKQPNAWGLHDMLGNVWEWVEDIYQDSYTGLPTDGSANTTRGDSSLRVLRGGSWNISGNYTRSATRDWVNPPYSFSFYGFRVVVRAR